MSDYLILFIVLGVILFSVILFFLINRQKLGKLNQFKNISSLGFIRADEEKERITQIISTYRNDSEKFIVKNIFYKPFPDGKIFIIDMLNEAEGESTPFAENSVLIESDLLNLPRFSIYPKVQLSGWVGTLTNQFLEQVYQRLGTLIEGWDNVEFETRYVVIGENEEKIRHILTNSILDRINGFLNLVIDFNQHTFLLNQIKFDQNNNENKLTPYLITTALNLFNWIVEEKPLNKTPSLSTGETE